MKDATAHERATSAEMADILDDNMTNQCVTPLEEYAPRILIWKNWKLLEYFEPRNVKLKQQKRRISFDDDALFLKKKF